jgi:hypothetical protein
VLHEQVSATIERLLPSPANRLPYITFLKLSGGRPREKMRIALAQHFHVAIEMAIVDPAGAKAIRRT